MDNNFDCFAGNKPCSKSFRMSFWQNYLPIFLLITDKLKLMTELKLAIYGIYLILSQFDFSCVS